VKPLQSIAMGLVIVALGARVNGYDLLADPIGWILVVRGVRGLPGTVPWLDNVLLLGWLALAVSVPLWFPGVVDTLSDTDDSLLWAVNLPQVTFAAATCAALARTASDAADRSAGSWLRTTATLTVVAGLLPVLVYVVDPDLLVPMLLLAVVALVMMIVLLFRYASRPWAHPGGNATGAAPPGGGTAPVVRGT
jgi:hypothetical protein